MSERRVGAKRPRGLEFLPARQARFPRRSSPSIGACRSCGALAISTTTARHYERWVGGDGYLEPVALRPGEVRSDWLARVAPEASPQNPHDWPSDREASGDEIDSVPTSRPGVAVVGLEPTTYGL
jgi:hypothetical protein